MHARTKLWIFLASPRLKGFVAGRTKYPLARLCISQVLNSALAVSTPETGCAERLVAGEDC